ncbi:hypothetical protein [Arcobacter arenosus]|uniref:hypothetical protein n=1 Tax=Arcobacter arenosus TaxID=2576037 RepID=UPI003BABBA64
MFVLFISGCSFSQPKIVSSATILIKTPKLKFYDKGFISRYSNYTEVQILSAGTAVLKLKIYEDRICRDTFECQASRVFNEEYLNRNYDENFLKNLFESDKKEIIHRDKENGILIKIKKD